MHFNSYRCKKCLQCILMVPLLLSSSCRRDREKALMPTGLHGSAPKSRSNMHQNRHQNVYPVGVYDVPRWSLLLCEASRR
jgi:hypothetical protein